MADHRHVSTADGVTDGMVRVGEDAIGDLLQMLGILPGETPDGGYQDEPYARTISRAVLSAALAGYTVVPVREPDGVEKSGDAWWEFIGGGKMWSHATGRFDEHAAARFRSMAAAMLSAAEHADRRAAGSQVGDRHV